MPFDQPVIQIMTENPVTLDVNQNLSDARSIFSKGHIHHLPVVDEGKLVGMMNSNDVIKLSVSDDDDRPLDDYFKPPHSVASIMRKNPVSVGVETTIREAALILASGSFHGLPVVGYNNVLKGIVTSTDLIQLLLEKLPHTASA